MIKAINKILILFIVLNLATWIVPQKVCAQVSIDFQIFYDDLSPYGDWVDNPDYGYVWVPNVSPGFTPYGTNGYWIFTDAGWTWVSNYSWGWAPFHYGRWYRDPVYGSVWVPGYEWGPGWVTWRRSESYYGWAPIGPGISIDIAYSSGYSLPYDQWRFVRNRDFGRTNITNYYVRSSGNTTIINNSTVINNIRSDRSNNVRYNQGPDRTEAQRRAGRKFTPVVLRERIKPGQNLSKGELQLYRPQLQKDNSAGRRPAPSRVANWKDVKPAAQRNNRTQSQREDQPTRQQPVQPRRNDQPSRQQPAQQQKRSDQQQPPQRQRNDQPAKQQPQQRQRTDQPARQQPQQRQHNDQPARQRQQQNDQPSKQQPVKQERRSQPKKDNN